MAHPLKHRRRFSLSRLKYLMVACLLAIISYSYVYHGSGVGSVKPRDAAGNSTLGFQKIVVLSEGPSWRTRGLKAAAEYSGIDLEIPIQALFTDQMIDAFQKMGPESAPHPDGRGEVRNWLSFLDIIKYIVAQDLESALILEDDVDWDVSIKDSMKLLSDAARKFTLTEEQDRSPYGHSWDLLWIGHCAEPTRNETRRLLFEDPSAPHPGVYIGWSKNYMEGIMPGTRSVQRGLQTHCSFGIALSRRGAIKVLQYAGKGEDKSFDFRIKNGCTKKDLSCLVVNPELMHHYVPPGEFGHVSTVADANERGSRAEEEEFEHVMGNTPNILRSARCKALFDSACPGPGQGLEL
ncbi:glycosyltransferase family 25 protein [Stipitochalara longipes BDJ]|nr:glycosyltransferase family 25 protein [Stipitochalara longipes BDJ]